MKRLCIVLLVLLGHQALSFPKKKQQNSIHKSVNMENLTKNPGITIKDTGVPMFSKQPRLGKPMAHQVLTKHKRKQHQQSIFNIVPVNKIKDQVKIGGQMISDNFRQTQSCGGEYTSDTGSIIFPSNGLNYQNDEDCIWTIKISSSTIEITFESFDTEQDYDYLYIRDGDSSGSNLLESLSGDIDPSPIQTTGNTAYLRFTSDSSITKTGFELSWKPTSEPSGGSDCGCGCEYTTSTGIIRFPLNGDNYQNNEECIWTIRISSSPIEITFDSFDTEQDYDYLYVRDGDSSGSNLLESLSGDIDPSPIQTKGNTAYLRFTSDSSVTRTGFELSWKPTSEPSGGSDCACGQANRASRIVNGVETEENEYPWQAAMVHHGTFNVFCGASVIGSKHVLTAAHCTQAVTDYSLTYQVLVGAHGLTTAASSQLVLDATRIIQHSDYDSTNYDNDISIIELSNHIDFTSSEVRPICLPDNDDSDYDDVTATVSGWGNTESGGSNYDVLLEVDVPTMSNTQCRGYYNDASITDNMICAGYEEGGKDSCQNDSGGPLVFESSNGHTQIGVVSWGDGCAKPRYPGVYARVTKYLSWISTNSASSNTCPAA